jgi:hypothetical protein
MLKDLCALEGTEERKAEGGAKEAVIDVFVECWDDEPFATIQWVWRNSRAAWYERCTPSRSHSWYARGAER